MTGTKKITLFILAPLLFCGCQVKPEDAVGAFMKFCARKNINNASAMCTPEFRNSFSKLPFAMRNYEYGIREIKWELSDISKVADGLRAHVFVTIFRDWPEPRILKAYLKIHLVKINNRWYVSAIDTVIPEYIYYTEKPGDKKEDLFITSNRPKWKRETKIDEPLGVFLKKYNEDCYSWLH